MKPDSRKDAMEVDACLQEEESVAAEHDREKDPACDGGKSTWVCDRGRKEGPWFCDRELEDKATKSAGLLKSTEDHRVESSVDVL